MFLRQYSDGFNISQNFTQTTASLQIKQTVSSRTGVIYIKTQHNTGSKKPKSHSELSKVYKNRFVSSHRNNNLLFARRRQVFKDANGTLQYAVSFVC